MTTSTPATPHNAGTVAAAFAVVLAYTVTDGFRVAIEQRPDLLADMLEIVGDAQSKSTVETPHVPAAVLVELHDRIYSHAFQTSASPRRPEAESLGVQGTLDDWAWLITDSIEKAYSLASIHRVYFHARVSGLLTKHAQGTSLYLPAAIRQRLATARTSEEVTP